MNQTISYLLSQAKQQLTSVADNPALEADILLAHVLQKSRSYLHAWPEKEVTEEQEKQFNEFLKRRLNNEPIAHITGRKEFWSLEFDVTKDTLIPRPETELLVEIVLELIKTPEAKIADLGTGSGAIALSIAHEHPTWQIYAIDISDNVLQIARNNAQRFGLKNVSFCLSNWCTALPCADFDVIVSNPPYIAENEWNDYANGLQYEPLSALVSGADGLDAIREISRSAKHHLKARGYLLIEHGFGQAQAVREIFLADGYSDIRSFKDLLGHERATLGCYQPDHS